MPAAGDAPRDREDEVRGPRARVVGEHPPRLLRGAIRLSRVDQQSRAQQARVGQARIEEQHGVHRPQRIAGEADVANNIIYPAVTGNYVVTPNNLKGTEPLYFVGAPPAPPEPAQPARGFSHHALTVRRRLPA